MCPYTREVLSLLLIEAVIGPVFTMELNLDVQSVGTSGYKFD